MLLNHSGLLSIIACNTEDESCMFSHCNKCGDLITVDRLGVAAAPYNVTSIIWFQWVETDEGMNIKCEQEGSTDVALAVLA